MAIVSKMIVEGDMKQLTITKNFDGEPFPSAAHGGKMRVRDEPGALWTFKYKVKSTNERVLSGHWMQFVQNNSVRVGDTVAIDKNDGWSSEAAEYKVEVIRRVQNRSDQ
ncbi:Uncharacterized protein TCM_006270 [Theobroma cacao]|uniref:TF-B3 domain-containing protein n=1 Tax=Theobroma cacao TaxID=3641 RepID=A0A061E4M6_THECC|nr:Uncharacterized protein TCM_006270 [Theobroma cacao]